MFADKGLGRCMPGGRGRRTLPRAISPLSKKNRTPRNENTNPRPVSTTPISAPGAHPFSGLLRSGIHTARARHPSVTSAVAPRDRTPSIVQHPAPKMSLHRRQAPSSVCRKLESARSRQAVVQTAASPCGDMRRVQGDSAGTVRPAPYSASCGLERQLRGAAHRAMQGPAQRRDGRRRRGLQGASATQECLRQREPWAAAAQRVQCLPGTARGCPGQRPG